MIERHQSDTMNNMDPRGFSYQPIISFSQKYFKINFKNDEKVVAGKKEFIDPVPAIGVYIIPLDFEQKDVEIQIYSLYDKVTSFSYYISKYDISKEGKMASPNYFIKFIDMTISAPHGSYKIRYVLEIPDSKNRKYIFNLSDKPFKVVGVANRIIAGTHVYFGLSFFLIAILWIVILLRRCTIKGDNYKKGNSDILMVDIILYLSTNNQIRNLNLKY